MTVAHGQVVYSVGSPPCTGLGLTWLTEELNAALAGPVAKALFDDEGNSDVHQILSEAVETEFEQNELQRVFTDTTTIEDWRVGEAIAATWLTDHRDCCFPWPAKRDERKLGSSLPGADLVGLHTDSKGECLAFGEVKTSSEAKYPPRVMIGRTGLRQQLADIRDNKSIRNRLLVYLGQRAKGTTWITKFQRAAKRYLANSTDVHLFGFLVRDVPASMNDVRARTESLAQDCPTGTKIEILALYLPADRIRGIVDDVITTRLGAKS